MGQIAENLCAVRERIESARARSSGGPVTIVGACKTKGAESCREAILAGIDALGENRVQELLEKYPQGAYEGAPLHFIGRLQSNKAKSLIGRAELIHSVDSLPLLWEIARRASAAGAVQDVLVQVNIAGELSKGGVEPAAADELLSRAGELSGVRVRGLMAIPPIYVNNAESGHYFARMYKLFVDMRAKKYDNVSMDFLSMGMSGDYEAAVCEGSNMVRIGSAIFGGRA